MTQIEILKNFEEHFINHPENRSIDKAGICSYRGLDNKKCAVGRYISDENYLEKFEGNQVSDIWLDIQEFLPVSSMNFWEDLQGLHDYPKYWNSKGLTSDGLTKWKNIKERYWK